MKYLLLVYSNPQNWAALSQDERDQNDGEHAALNEELAESGMLVSSEELADPANTSTVQVRKGVPAITDGPFAEAKEHLAGYYLVECEHLDEAIAIAARIPEAQTDAVEVRPVLGPGGMEM